MAIELSYYEVVAVALCLLVAGMVRYHSIPVYSLIEKEEYLYLGRVFLWITKGFYSIYIPYWFIDQSVTTKFVVSLPKHFIRKNGYAEMIVKTKGKRQLIHIKEESAFFLY